MRDKLVELLAGALQHVKVALGSIWKRHTAPPGVGERETYTDQW